MTGHKFITSIHAQKVSPPCSSVWRWTSIKIKSVDLPVFDFFPRYDSLKTKENGQITLKHALTMTAGFSEEEGNAGKR